MEGHRVLIVSAKNPLFLEAYFGGDNVRTNVARMVTEAVNVLESTPDVDVILLDKTLKEGGDGAELLHYLEFKERIGKTNPPVVTISPENFYETGVALYLGEDGLRDAVRTYKAAEFVELLRARFAERKGEPYSPKKPLVRTTPPPRVEP